MPGGKNGSHYMLHGGAYVVKLSASIVMFCISF